jgi:autotransporter-associated beta strand protein
VAYLDGQRPSLVMCRGYYAKTVLAAWNWRNGQLTNLWVFNSMDAGNSGYAGQGNHNLSVGDVDGDGKDEIVYGACAIDHNGARLYTTGLGHGDAMHLSDMDPDRPGLEVWEVHETPSSYSGGELHDAATGQILWGLSATGDTGRGLAAHVDPLYRGYQMWSSSSAGTYNKDGTLISTARPSYNFAVWWDADLERELLDVTDSKGKNPKLEKWNGNGVDRVLSLYNYPSSYACQANNGSKGNPCLSGDILGDWREEMIYRLSDGSGLIVFTTTTPANNRFYTFMHDPQYRLSIAWQNVAYNQPPHTSFYVGEGMAKPPVPPVSDANLVWRGGAATNAWDATTTTNWYANWQLSGIWTSNTAAVFNQGDTVLFDLSGSNTTPVKLVGTLTPGKVTVHSPKDYVFGGSGSLAGTTTVVKAGVGTLTINTTNTYSGATLVTDGTLILNGTLEQSPVTVENRGTLLRGTLQIGSGGTTGALGTNDVVNNGTLTFNRSDALSYGGVISGSGRLVKLGGGALTLMGANTYGGVTTISNGTLQVGNGGATGTLGTNNVVNIGTLTFNRSDVISCDAVISGSGRLIQLGSGTLTLTRSNTFSGGTTISNGTLLVNNTIGSGTGTGAVTATSTGTLGGTGIIAGPVTVNGTLAPGSPDTGVGVGTLTVSNNLVVNTGAVLAYELGAASDKTVVISNLTLGGTLNISDAGGFGAGTYTLFTYGGALTYSGVAIGTAPAGYTYGINTNTPTQVNLIVLTPFQQWQIDYFSSTTNPAAAPDADPDGDGMSNTNEFLAGTNPTNSLSALRIISVLAQSNDVNITWATAGGRTNAVQATAGDGSGGYSTNFNDISGSIIIPGSGDVTTNYTDIGGATNSPSRYYRIRLVP